MNLSIIFVSQYSQPCVRLCDFLSPGLLHALEASVGLFHAATSLLNLYKMACIGDILYVLTWVKFISILSIYVQSGTQAFSLKNYCSFNTKSYFSDVCGYHRCPQTLVEICRNIGIWCNFRAGAHLVKISGVRVILKFTIVKWVPGIDLPVNKPSCARTGPESMGCFQHKYLCRKSHCGIETIL